MAKYSLFIEKLLSKSSLTNLLKNEGWVCKFGLFGLSENRFQIRPEFGVTKFEPDKLISWLM